VARLSVVVETPEVYGSVFVPIRAPPGPPACFVGAVVHVTVGKSMAPQAMLHAVPEPAQEDVARVKVVVDSLTVLPISLPLPLVHVAVGIREIVIALLSAIRIDEPLW
jgi:hypothetical protein